MYLFQSLCDFMVEGQDSNCPSVHQRCLLLLTGDVQSEVDSRTSSRQTETHNDEDGGVRRDAHQHPEHHRQGQGGQQSLGPAQPAETQTCTLKDHMTHTHLCYYTTTRWDKKTSQQTLQLADGYNRVMICQFPAWCRYSSFVSKLQINTVLFSSLCIPGGSVNSPVLTNRCYAQLVSNLMKAVSWLNWHHLPHNAPRNTASPVGLSITIHTQDSLYQFYKILGVIQGRLPSMTF